jgi:hypothetical protein
LALDIFHIGSQIFTLGRPRFSYLQPPEQVE